MITYERLFDKYDDKDAIEIMTAALESLAYRLLCYKYPDYYSIPQEKIVELLKEEGIDCDLEKKWVE